MNQEDTSVTGSERPTKRWRFFPHALAMVLFAALASVSGLLWFEMQSKFPLPPTGSYIGTLSGIFPDGQATLFVERSEDGGSFIVALFRKGWEVAPLAVTAEEIARGSLAPVVLTGEQRTIRLIGAVGPNGNYVGGAEELTSGTRGRWELHAIPNGIRGYEQRDAERVLLWLRLREELLETDRRITEASARVPQQKIEIDRLTSFVTEKGKLRASSEAKLAGYKEQIAKLQEENVAKQQQAGRLLKKLEISQQVTPAGRLVSLSRESLERENRWIDSMLRSSVQSSSRELELLAEKGEQILKLKAEIAEEQRRIDELSGGGTGL